jgi:hypothetical protein
LEVWDLGVKLTKGIVKFFTKSKIWQAVFQSFNDGTQSAWRNLLIRENMLAVEVAGHTVAKRVRTGKVGTGKWTYNQPGRSGETCKPEFGQARVLYPRKRG